MPPQLLGQIKLTSRRCGYSSVLTGMWWLCRSTALPKRRRRVGVGLCVDLLMFGSTWTAGASRAASVGVGAEAQALT